MDSEELFHQYLLGNLEEDQVNELSQRLETDAALRRQFLLAAQIDSALHNEALNQSIDAAQNQPAARKQFIWFWPAISMFAMAASLLISFSLWNFQPAAVATLVSSENAAWESELPTRPGSELSAGLLKLKAGVATIRFHSGAVMIVEAPASVQLISKMKAKMESGAAVMDVPDSAIGFVVETPDAYAIDYGTRFAVNVDSLSGLADFELIEGEIEVHHPNSGRSLRLNEAGSAVVTTSDDVQAIDSETSGDPVDPSSVSQLTTIRIATKGRCGSAMFRSQKRHKYISPELLSVKRTDSGKWDFRSFFEFDVKDVSLDAVASARLRINLVPSHRGLASRLPRINRFAIYGVTNPSKATWEVESSWEDSPGPEDGILLGTFEIQRSETRGVFGIQNAALLEFLRENQERPVTFVLVRETTHIDGTGPALVHQFASDRHPETVGPLLEFSLRK